MKEFFKAVGKGLVLFGVAAALWAVFTPLLASGVAAVLGVQVATGTTAVAAIQASGLLINALYTGASFGMFGGLYAAVNSIASGLFNDAPAAQQPAAQPKLVRVRAIMHDPEQAVEFAKKIEEARKQQAQHIARN